MLVAIIGAGVTGLVNARVLTDAGLDVVVIEKMPDLGGVWSTHRGYPGVRTQNDKRTYALSDLPMADEYPEHPTGRQIHDYLTEYADRHALTPLIRLATTVLNASARDDGGWDLELESAEGLRPLRADWLIVATGLYSRPNLPRLPGQDEFEAAGGVVVDASAVGDGDLLAGRDVVVIGWGKSAADIAVAATSLSRRVTMVVRRVDWKLPYRVGRFGFQTLTISRLGEHLLWAPYRTLVGGLLKKLDAPLRALYVRALSRRVRRQLQLDRRGLVPGSPISGFSHLATHGFYESVESDAIDLHVDSVVAEASGGPDGPTIALSDGRVISAHVVVAATGYDQDVSFFDAATRAELLEPEGDLVLYRHTLPRRVRNLVFAGWMNSFRSPIGAEVQALWTAALIHGLVRLPSPGRRLRFEQHLQLTHALAAARALPQYSAGLSILDQDAWIREAGLRLPLGVQVRELLRPIDPRDYAQLHEQLRRRLERLDRRPAEADGTPAVHDAVLRHH